MRDEALLFTLAESCGKARPEAAQRAWYDHCYAYGITVALYYSSSREEAEEILQDSFLKVFAYFTGHPPPRAQRPWFRRLIINTAIDHYRRKRTGWFASLLPDRVAHNGAIEQLNDEDLYLLLQRLPPRYRLTFNLHVLEGYSHAEIAERLGTTVGTSKSNLHKARTLIKRLAGAYFNLDNRLSNA